MSAACFVGTWRLIYFEHVYPDGQTTYPQGRQARGLLTYTADGYMSLAIMSADRPLLSSMTSALVADQEYAAAAESYISYAGRYEVTEEEILHHIEVCLWQNWVGGTQRRHYAFRKSQLILSLEVAPEPGVSSMIWERAGLTA